MSLKVFLTGLFLALFLSMSSAAINNNADMSGLTDAQKAEILKQIAQAQEPAPAVASQVDKVTSTAQAWVGIGSQIGQGLASTAKELGIAANDFVQTPVGKWTAAIIIWKFVGNPLIHLVVGAFIFLVILPAWVIFWRKRVGGLIRTPTDKTWLFGAFRCHETRYDTRLMDGEHIAVMIIGCIVIFAAGLITTFSM